jgi:hypothetical protein
MSTMSTPPKGPGSPRLAASDPQLRSRDLDRVSNALVTLKDTTPSVTGTRSALIGAGGSLWASLDRLRYGCFEASLCIQVETVR